MVEGVTNAIIIEDVANVQTSYGKEKIVSKTIVEDVAHEMRRKM